MRNDRESQLLEQTHIHRTLSLSRQKKKIPLEGAKNRRRMYRLLSLAVASIAVCVVCVCVHTYKPPGGA